MAGAGRWTGRSRSSDVASGPAVNVAYLVEKPNYFEKSQFVLDLFCKSEYVCAIPCPSEGRFAIVSIRGAGCDGRCGVRQLLAGRDRRSVRRSRVVLAPRPWRLSSARQVSPDNGDNQRRSPGRARISRKAIAWGKPGCLGCTCSRCPCACTWDSRVLLHTGSTGAVSARLSLRPLRLEGQRGCKTRTNHAARMRTCVLIVGRISEA